LPHLTRPPVFSGAASEIPTHRRSLFERPAAAALPQQERRFGTPPLLFKLDRVSMAANHVARADPQNGIVIVCHYFPRQAAEKKWIDLTPPPSISGFPKEEYFYQGVVQVKQPEFRPKFRLVLAKDEDSWGSLFVYG